jgi:hypothetical protein
MLIAQNTGVQSPIERDSDLAISFLNREGFVQRTDYDTGTTSWYDVLHDGAVHNPGEQDYIGDYLANHFAVDARGNWIFGTKGVDYQRADFDTAPVRKTIGGVEYIRTGFAPELAKNPMYSALYAKYDPSLWGSYDQELGWFTPTELAANIEANYQVYGKDRGTAWSAFAQTIGLALAFTGAALAAGFTATAEAGAVSSAASGATSSVASGSVAGGSTTFGGISTDFSLAGSGTGIGGVGTSGLGLQVPATLGGAPTVGGLGLASSGAATTALLTPELLAPLGLEGIGLPGLTATQAAAAAAASGISAPATGASLWDTLSKAPTPSTGSGSTLPAWLGTAKNAVGLGTSLAGLFGAAGSSGSSSTAKPSSSTAAPRAGVFSGLANDVPLFNPSQWSTGEFSSLALAAVLLVGVYALAKHKGK